MPGLTEVFLTVIAGVSVFVAGQIFVKLMLEPIQDFWRLTGEIAHSLIYYGDVYSNPGASRDELLLEARDTLRDKASALRSRAYAITIYRLWSSLEVIPPVDDVIEASVHLIGLSNGVFQQGDRDSNEHRKKEIEKLLWIRH